MCLVSLECIHYSFVTYVVSLEAIQQSTVRNSPSLSRSGATQVSLPLMSDLDTHDVHRYHLVSCYIASLYFIVSLYYITSLYFIASLYFITNLHFITILNFISNLYFITSLYFISNLYFITSLYFVTNISNKKLLIPTSNEMRNVKVDKIYPCYIK